MPISRIGTDGIDQTSSQQIGGISVGRGGGAVSTNTAVGASALAANTTGLNTSVFGGSALAANTTGNANNSFGYQSLYSNTTGGTNCVFGTQAMYYNTTGSSNVAFGHNALQSNTTASYNTAVGYQAAYSSTGQTATAFGARALYSNTTGIDNVAMGYASLYGNTTGGSNVAVGHSALQSNTTASNNVAVGYQAGYSNTTGYSNTLIGFPAGYSLTTGYLNTFVGKDSGYYVTTGAKNSILGAYNGNQGGLDIRTASNYIVLSDGDGNPRLNIDNNGAVVMGKVAFDDTTQGFAYRSSGYISVVRSSGAPCYFNRLTSTGTVVEIAYNSSTVGTISTNGTTTSYNTSSDYRLKENIAPMTGALATVAQLKPCTYNWKSDGSEGQGFIAHELQAVVPDAVVGAKDAVDENGNPVYQGIDTSFLVATLTAAIQELKAEFDAYKEAHP